MLATETDKSKEFEFHVSDTNAISKFYSTSMTVYKRQLYRLVSNKTQLLFVVLMPLMWLVIIGQAFTGLIGTGTNAQFAGLDYLTFMTPGILIMTTMFTGLFGAINLFYDRDSGYMKNYLIAPISRTGIIFGYTLGISTRIIIQDAIIIVIAVFLGVSIELTIVNLLAIIGFALLVTLFLEGIAITIASRAPNVEVFQTMITPIALPMQFMSSVMFPVSVLPDYFQWLANINPITWGTDGLRNILLKIPVNPSNPTGPKIPWPIIPGSFATDFTKWLDGIFNLNLTNFFVNNILWFDIGILLIVGFFFLYIGGKAFLRSLEG